MSVVFNNEVTNRDIVDFKWNEALKKADNDYEKIRNIIIDDMNYMEESNLVKFQINDIEMAIPPLHIGINKENLEYSWKTLRSKASTKVFSNSAVYNVQLTLLFPRECLLQLHRLILEIRNNPFVCIRNKYLSSSLTSNDYHQVVKFQNTNINGTIMKSTHFAVTNLQCVNYQASPGAFLLELDLRIFNTIPYSLDLKYRHDLKYLLPNNLAATIDVFFKQSSSDATEGLYYEDRIVSNTRIFNQKTTTVQQVAGEKAEEPEVDQTKDPSLTLRLEDKMPSFGVEYPYESCIYVRYYNYLQIKHLHLNFNIQIEDLLVNFPVQINGMDGLNIKGFHDLFNIGLYKKEFGNSYRVLSIAGKYLPVEIRNQVINSMLLDDDTFTIMYETYITINLEASTLKKMREVFMNDIRFNDAESSNNKYVNQIDENVNSFKDSLLEYKNNPSITGGFVKTVNLYNVRNSSGDGGYSFAGTTSINKEVRFEREEVDKILAYIGLTNNQEFAPDYSALVERRLNVYSNVEVFNLAAAATETNRELTSLLQLKPLVVTSCSAMLTNSLATIPIAGHTYPTYQYLGSHEPVYQMTFAASSFGNDPENLDDLPKGIQNIESFRYEMEHNIQNFKQIPNSQAFTLNCFITKLFDSYRNSDVNVQLEDTNNGDTKISRRLIKKRLSINAINTQTLEGSPGTTVGSFRFTETNNYDLEKLQLVYNSDYENLNQYAKSIYKLARAYCYTKGKPTEEFSKKLTERDDEKILRTLKDFVKSKFQVNDTVNEGTTVDSDNRIYYAFDIEDFKVDISPDKIDFKDLGILLKDQGVTLDEIPVTKEKISSTQISNDTNLLYLPSFLESDTGTISNDTLISVFGTEDKKKGRIVFSFNDNELSLLTDVQAKGLQYIERLLESSRKKQPLTRQQEEMNNLLQMICMFPLLVSSILIEPEYYFEDTGAVSKEINEFSSMFFNLFNFHPFYKEKSIDSNEKSIASPSYMRFLRYWLINGEKEKEGGDGFFLQNNIEKIAKGEIKTKLEDKYFQPYLDHEILASFGVAAVSGILGVKLGWVGTAVILGASIGLQLPGRMSERQTKQALGSTATNAQKVRLFVDQIQKLNADSPAWPRTVNLFIQNDFMESLYNSYLGIKIDTTRVSNILIKENLMGLLNYGANNQDELSDIASKVASYCLNLNPLIHFYSQVSEEIDSEIANSILHPDRESVANKLIFNGFEQIIFGYLYWFPKHLETLVGIDIASTDLKYFEDIFKLLPSSVSGNPLAPILDTIDGKNTLNLRRDDNLQNMLVTPEWSLTMLALSKQKIEDDINPAIQSNSSDPILISLDKINTLKEAIKENNGYQRHDYLVRLCNKDEKLRNLIQSANRNRLVYLDQLFKNLLIKVLHNQKVEEYVRSLAESGTDRKVTSFVKEVNGLDLSGIHCYQDIDLPTKPLTGGREKLNPGFYYFDNNTEVYTEEQIKDVKRRSKNLAKRVLNKSDKFMTHLRLGEVYTGEDSINMLEALPNSRLNTGAGDLDQAYKNLTLQDANLIDFQEGGDLYSLYNLSISDEKDSNPRNNDGQNNNSANGDWVNKYNSIYTHPPIHVSEFDARSDTKDDTNPDVKDTDKSSNPLDPVRIPIYKIKRSINETIKVTDATGKQVDQIVKKDVFETKEFIGKTLNSTDAIAAEGQVLTDSADDSLLQNRIVNLLGDSTLVYNNQDIDSLNENKLFYASNFNLLDAESGAAELDASSLASYSNFLKNALYSDTQPSTTVILNSLDEQLGFFNKRTIAQMYPTFKFYIIEEDAVESENPLVFDDFYNYNAVKDITVYKNRKLPADTAIIRLQNISGSIDGGKTTGIRDIDFEMAGMDEGVQEEGSSKPQIEVNSILLRPGVSAQLRMGYDSNPNNLEVMLSGKITDINWSSNGDMCEVVLQSFGVELLGKKLGTEEDGIGNQFVFKNTDSILKFMIHQSDLQHFGRYKNTSNDELYKDKPHLKIKIGNPKKYEKTWLETIKGIFEANSLYTAIGIGITGALAAFVAIKSPTAARYLTRVGQFIFKSKFITAISLGANKLIFRGFGSSISDDAIVAIAQSVTAAGPKVATTKFEWLKQLLMPTWGGWFMGNVTRFRDLVTKIGYNQALLRILTSADDAAKAATTVIKNKGAFNIMLTSFMGGAFKAYINLQLIGLTLGLSAQLISASIDAFGLGFKSLFSDSKDQISNAKKALETALKEPRIMLSPMDDCIFPPTEDTYICPIDASDPSITSDDPEAKKRFKHCSRVIVAETMNTIADIFLRSWAFGSLVDIPFGFLEYRFKVTPFVTSGNGAGIKFENSAMLQELTRNPYAVADKRLYEAYGENQYQIFNKTIWEVVEEMTLRHPGWVASTRPFGLGPEYRLFFGMPNGKYYKHPLSEVEKQRYNEIFDLFFELNSSGNFQFKTSIDSIDTTDLVSLSSASIRRNSKLIYDEIKRRETDEAIVEAVYKSYLKRNILKDFTNSISNRITTFRKYHYLTTDTNIVSSNISINDKAINTVKVNYLHIDSENVAMLSDTIHTRKLQAHPYIPEDAINEASWSQSNPDTIQCKGYGAALRYGMSLLINGAKEMYDGEIITIGNPSINPFDIVLIEDKVNGVSGPIEVEAVTHMFSFETGFLTEIKPNALVAGNEAMTYSITSTAPVFLATEQVVKRISNRSYANGKPNEKRKVDEDTRNEIKAILADYFTVPNKNIFNSFVGLNKPNFWFDYVNKSGFERLFKSDTITNKQLKEITNTLEEAVLENIISALEANRIDTLVNMKQGLFQVPQGILDRFQKINSDIFTAGTISAIVGGSVNALASRFTVETLSKGWVVNSLGLLKNSGKLGAIVAVGSLVFGDKIESIVEGYMQNEGTLNNVLGLTQETRFSKINDGTLLHIFPLYKNDRALIGAGFQYIRQNEIWHNRVGSIYNDISDAARGYIQAKKELQTRTSLLSDEELKKLETLDSNNPFQTVTAFLYNRYIAADDITTDEKYKETKKALILSNTSPDGLLQIDF